jgi:glutamine amidotransferase
VLTLVDLGVGNIGSLSSALRFLGAEHVVTTDLLTVRSASVLILPGVGSFSAAVERLDELSLRCSVLDHVASGRPLLGVCVGMQLLLDESEEGEGAGLGLVPGRCERLGRVPGAKVPHVGFDTVIHPEGSWLAHELGRTADHYFTHSFALRSSDPSRDGWCDYDGGFVAVVDRWPVLGAQFHPEKSQTSGLGLLRAFLRRARGGR